MRVGVAVLPEPTFLTLPIMPGRLCVILPGLMLP
jgi:hypothetical protein